MPSESVDVDMTFTVYPDLLAMLKLAIGGLLATVVTVFVEVASAFLLSTIFNVTENVPKVV